MENKLEKKYGLFTAMGMVIGIVIGSGVFFKAQNVLNSTNGDMPLGILAWIIGGVVMIICGINFATLATKYEKVNGLVDYAEATVGSKYAYMLGWFMETVYVPGMTSALAWVSARYTLAIFVPSGILDINDTIASDICLALAGFYLIASYCINALAPKLAGKLQVSMTVIKLIPLILMAFAGIIVGLKNGNVSAAFATSGASAAVDGGSTQALLASVVAVAFAYEGWILATSINSELKNSKRNLPLALTLGSIVIIVIYIIYYIGISGAVPIEVLREQGANAAFVKVFGNVGGTLVGVCIAISCLGTLNGLMLSQTRGMYSVAANGRGPKPKMFAEVSPSTNMPSNSSIIGLLICAAWLVYFFIANLYSKNFFGLFSFDSSELPIITIYAFYIPMFILYIKKNHKEGFLRHVLLPILAIISCAFMVFAALYSHGYSPMMSAKAAKASALSDSYVYSADEDSINVVDGGNAVISMAADGEINFSGYNYAVENKDAVITCTFELPAAEEVALNNADTGDAIVSGTGACTVKLTAKDGKIVNVKLNDAEADCDVQTVSISALNANPHFSCPVLFYLIVFAAFMVIGVFFMKKKEYDKAE